MKGFHRCPPAGLLFLFTGSRSVFRALAVRALESLLNCKETNQSILKETNPEYSLERLMLKLKLQYFGHLIQRTDSLEKTLMLERLKERGEGDDRG